MDTRVMSGFVIALLLCTGSLYAQNFELIYSEGDISVKEGSSWVDVYPGDLLPANSVVRLDNGEIAEFASDSGTVLFSKAGTYQLKSVAERKNTQQVSGLSSVFSRVAKIGNSSDKGQSQVMGVRAAEAEDEFEFTWVEEDTLSFDEAVAAYNEQDFNLAVDIFENEVDPMLLNDEGSYWFYLASSYMNMGENGPALRIALNHDIDEYSTAYADFILLKGRLLLESLDYSQASDEFKRYIDSSNAPAQLQLGNFLYGYALYQSGNVSAARKALSRAVEIDADSEITRMARQLM